ncbi:acyl- oxidase [Malassezia pachydermatis]|uniref:Acyl-coenzyme A oxidase n=1 Tax=Malassezia pachydermatis TaxID=77020 RepID=A0A0N0RRY1_9BASI|nr:acyl- oxidase [Malassezia pachydermatis]KOS12872.1 acyl- oxidase [Malassezia pachydermatis]
MAKANLTMETLAKERLNPPFDLHAMAVANHGSETRLQFKRRVMLELERNNAFFNDDFYDLTEHELRERTFIKIGSIVNWLQNEPLDVFRQRLEVISVADPGFWTRFGVHLGLFTNCVRSGSTSGQFAYWVNKGMLSCRNFYGCFGMTEICHGSNVQGIETTATFDEDTDEFIIHTPHLGATKWWIGGAAHSATHCAVFARLIVKGKDYGTKTFVVPLRNVDTYDTLPGVTIGDIGMKMGRNGIDNGYIQFTYVRVPRAYMLMRHCQVTREGQVFEPPMQQLAYGALLTGRVMMAVDSGNIGKKAITIAGRYAAVRRQFKSDPNQEYETVLLDYPIHQRRLMPLLAQAVAFQYTGQQLTHMLNSTTEALDALEPGDPKLEEVLELLKSTHASSSGLKAFCTWATLSAIEVCRQSLGGHGYSAYTGLAPLYNDFAVHCTWEGDNTILALQLGRALMSAYEEAKQGKHQGEALSYLNNIDQVLGARCGSEEELDTLEGIEAGWLTASAHFVKVASDEFERLIQAGHTREQAAEKCSQLRFVAASVHTSGFIFRQFRAAVNEHKDGSDGVKKTMATLAKLYGLWQMEEKSGFLLRSGWLKPEQFDYVSRRVTELCAEVRSFAIPLIDSFEYSDFVINSPFGRYDGNIYQEYFNMVRRNNPVLKPHPYFERLIKPLISRRVPEPEDATELMGLDDDIEEIQAEAKEALENARK